MNCYKHSEKAAIGTCVGCGKFICEECNTEIKGKNYCKSCVGELLDEKNKKIEKFEDAKASSAPMVFMNAGGGGGASSSSSAVNNNAGSGIIPVKTKSKVAAGLLGIFLGGLGVHKFYLGKWVQGLIYLLFCWTYIPSIIGFIEGIIYLVSSEQSFAAKYNTYIRA